MVGSQNVKALHTKKTTHIAKQVPMGVCHSDVQQGITHGRMQHFYTSIEAPVGVCSTPCTGRLTHGRV